MYRPTGRSARDHRHQLGVLTTSLGSAILGYLLDLWMPPLVIRGYWQTHTLQVGLIASHLTN